MKKKILAMLGAITIGVMSLVPVPAMAAGCDESFLGFRPWYQGSLLCEEVNGNAEIKSPPTIADKNDTTNMQKLAAYIWAIALNVLFDLFLVLGYLALGFVIYGGYLYIMSQGDPARAAKGKKTLISAITGTIIAMSATVIVNTISTILGLNLQDGANQSFAPERIQTIFDWAYSIAGLIAVIFIIKGGIEFMVSQGDPAKIQKAKRALTYAVVGLVIVVLAAVITGAVINSLGGAL